MTKADKLIIELINLQYKYANVDKTYEDSLKDENWYLNDTIEENVYINDFKPIAVNLIKKKLRCRKEYAEKQFSWFTLAYGLKYK